MTLAERLQPFGQATGPATPGPAPLPPRLGERLAQVELAPPATENTIPFGEWLPDLPDHRNPGATAATNVISATDRSYGPFPSLAVYSDALTARAQGAVSVQDDGANVNIFAGDATKLYRLVSGSTAWEDVSIVANYTTGSDELWRFAQYGQRVMATNKTDAIQSYVIGTSTDFAVLAAAAPKARYMGIVQNFLVAVNTNDGTDGDVPERVWWPAFGDPTDWPTIGSADAASKQSDRQDLFGDGGWNQGIVGGLGSADGVIFQERAVWRMSYVGPPQVFSIKPVEGARGTPAPNSVVKLGGLVFYIGDDLGFYAFDGLQSVRIGAGKVDRTFAGEVDQSNLHRVSGAFDPVGATVCWAFPGDGSLSGTPNKILVYKLSTQRWSVGELESEILVPAQTFGQTLEGLDSFGTLETLPASLDSRQWTGGRSAFAAFDTDHKLAYFSGPALAATLETGEFDGSGRRFLINGLRPIVDGGTVTASVGYRDAPADPIVYTTPTAAGINGICPQRIETRYARGRVQIAAGGDWSDASSVAAAPIPTGAQ